MPAFRAQECARHISKLHQHLLRHRSPCDNRLTMQLTMQLTINGDERSFDAPLSLAGLLEQLGLKLDRVAVEYNRNIVPRPQWSETSLADGDRLEIVQFVGGGAR